MPLRDFLVQTWACCACDRSCAERLAFTLLCRTPKWPGDEVNVIDHKDVERWVHHRYRLRPTNAKKKAHQVFHYIDSDGSGGISLSEFQEFGRTNLVFLAFGQFFIAKMRAKLFGDKYWTKQTAKRKKRYVVDKPFQKEIGEQAARQSPSRRRFFSSRADVLTRPPQVRREGADPVVLGRLPRGLRALRGPRP